MGMFLDRPVDMLWWSDEDAALHEVSEMQWGADHVYSSRETVTLGSTDVIGAREQLHEALIVRGYDPLTVEEIPFDIDVGEATDLFGLFAAMLRLKTVPDMDTSRVTGMLGMFELCEALTSVPDMDTSNVRDMGYMFNGCISLASVPHFDTSKVSNMESMFMHCKSLTTLPELDAGRTLQASGMFTGCASLARAPLRGLGVSLDLSDTVVGPAAADELMGMLEQDAGSGAKSLNLPESALGCDPRIAKRKGWQVDVPGFIVHEVSPLVPDRWHHVPVFEFTAATDSTYDIYFRIGWEAPLASPYYVALWVDNSEKAWTIDRSFGPTSPEESSYQEMSLTENGFRLSEGDTLTFRVYSEAPDAINRRVRDGVLTMTQVL